MSFLWGGREKFEKDDNTIRGVYKLNPSFGFIDKIKQYEMPVITILDKYFEDTLESITGDMVCEINTSYSDYTKYFFGHESFNDTLDIKAGGIISGINVIYNSFVEYRFLHYPYTGGIEENISFGTGAIFLLEYTRNVVG
jgi:hypothetical protein